MTYGPSKGCMPHSTNPMFKINERQFQAAILELARWQGWKVFHPLPAQNDRGQWRTATQGDIGFPDLVLVHPERGVIFAELKTSIGRATPDQKLSLETLTAAGVEAYLWRPIDIQAIRTRLGRTNQ